MRLQDIEPGTIIGPWRCYVLTSEDYTRLQATVPQDWQHPEGQSRAQAWQELLHRYEQVWCGPSCEHWSLNSSLSVV